MPPLMAAVASTLGLEPPSEDATVLLQQHGGRHGITDIEVRDPGRSVWIFEAKAGFVPPGQDQLMKYAARLNELHEVTPERVLIVLAQSDRRDLWLRRTVPETVMDVPVRVLSWRRVRKCVDVAYLSADNTGKALLKQLSGFLEEVIGMQSAVSNEVFVVSLSRETFGGTTTFVEVVEKHGKYFHPVGSGWPTSPPNYMGFRWDGRLQSIHHVDDYEVITDFNPHFPDVASAQVQPLFLYTLGPAMRPVHEVRTGNVYANGRKWAHLDLLLTCATVAEASDKSKDRVEAASRLAGD